MGDTVSHFRVYHGSSDSRSACLGIAKMLGKSVRYNADSEAYAWFETRSQCWLRDFKKIVKKLCRNVGHTSIFSINSDESSGITVERI